jgi:hypothetical protein
MLLDSEIILEVENATLVILYFVRARETSLAINFLFQLVYLFDQQE